MPTPYCEILVSYRMASYYLQCVNNLNDYYESHSIIVLYNALYYSMCIAVYFVVNGLYVVGVKCLAM